MIEWEMNDDEIADQDWRKEKKKSNMEFSTELLLENHIDFTAHNGGIHLIVENQFDFWPSTGKFINRKTKKSGRGVQNLLHLLNLINMETKHEQ